MKHENGGYGKPPNQIIRDQRNHVMRAAFRNNFYPTQTVRALDLYRA